MGRGVKGNVEDRVAREKKDRISEKGWERGGEGEGDYQRKREGVSQRKSYIRAMGLKKRFLDRESFSVFCCCFLFCFLMDRGRMAETGGWNQIAGGGLLTTGLHICYV